ncbi:MAG: hypothetical protein BWY76_01414 [bacterium ADurb.Bin429]|nr:MAG: hypothetical protein BWY76_01414 [bacterium ADurb.Bin429]
MERRIPDARAHLRVRQHQSLNPEAHHAINDQFHIGIHRVDGIRIGDDALAVPGSKLRGIVGAEGSPHVLRKTTAPPLVTKLNRFDAIRGGVSVARAHGRPIRHAGRQRGSLLSVHVSHQTRRVSRCFRQRFPSRQPIQQINDQDAFPPQRGGETKILVVAEAVGHRASRMSRRARPLRRASGGMGDHIGPVNVITVRPAGKAHDGNTHGAQGFDDLLRQRAIVASGNLRPRLPPTRPLQKLPEEPRVNRMQLFCYYGDADRILLTAIPRCHGEYREHDAHEHNHLCGAGYHSFLQRDDRFLSRWPAGA